MCFVCSRCFGGLSACPWIAAGKGSTKDVARKGVQDMSVTAVPAHSPVASSAAQSSGCEPCRNAILLAVTLRSCQLAIFAWPEVAPQATPGEGIPHTTARMASCQSPELPADAAASRSPQTNPPAASPDSELRTSSVSCSHAPMFLQRLSVPSPTSEVSWLPICWLPDRAACIASDIHDPEATASCQAPGTEARDTGESDTASQEAHADPEPACTSAEPPLHSCGRIALTGAGTGQEQTPKYADVDAGKPCAWLLVGLPSGKMSLWRVKINLKATHDMHALTSHSSHAPRAQVFGQASVPRSPAKGSWRRGASGDRGRGSDLVVVSGCSMDSDWRDSSAIEARQVKCRADDVHARMLFTVHAIPGSAQDTDARARWQVITTSYDRKTVSWNLDISEEGDNARLEACQVWTGTGADVRAMCTGQVCTCRCFICMCMFMSCHDGVCRESTGFHCWDHVVLYHLSCDLLERLCLWFARQQSDFK
jgi:hypothetical protein